MGCNIYGQIYFGVSFDECTEFPWEVEEYDGGIEAWWMAVNGYEPLHRPFTKEGEYADGWSRNDPRWDEHFAHRSKWEEENPMPVALESSGTGSCPLYMIVVPGIGRSSDWSAKAFKPGELVVTAEQVQALKDFLTKYEIEHDGEPTWLLSGYYSC